MNAAHLHLITVHIPVLFVPLGVLLLAWGTWRKDRSVSWVALSLFVLSFAVALVAEEAGEGAEEIVEHLAGIGEATIESHEEWAERSIVLTGVLALLSVCHLAATLWLKSAHRFLTPLVFVVGLATSAALAITAQKGGEIRHPEAFQSPRSDGGVPSAHEHDEDD